MHHVVKDRAALAHAAGKPIVLEEYGCCKAADYRGKRGELFRAFHDAADGAGYAGTIVWQVGSHPCRWTAATLARLPGLPACRHPVHMLRHTQGSVGCS